MVKTLSDQNERQYADYHHDGLLDLFIGLGAFFSGIWMYTDLIFMIGVIPASLLPVWMAARKSALRRLGVDEIPPAHQNRSRLTLYLGLIFGVLAFLAALGAYVVFSIETLPFEVTEWIGDNFIILLGVLIASMLVIGGLLTGIRRLIGYAGLLSLFLIGGEVLDFGLPTILTALGLVITTIGFWIFVRFSRRYPTR